MDEGAAEADAVDEVLDVLPFGEVVEHDRRMRFRIGRSQCHGASTFRTGEIHPELKSGNRDQLAVLQLPGERKKLELHVRKRDVVAGAKERAGLEEVGRAQTFAA